jgi:hypothetical protein
MHPGITAAASALVNEPIPEMALGKPRTAPARVEKRYPATTVIAEFYLLFL